MGKKKIICVWIGKFESEKDFYQDYLRINYDDNGNSISRFGVDAGLENYDQDFMESWWFEKFDVNKLIEFKEDLLDSDYFYEELIAELRTRNPNDINFISFIFGELSENPINEILFEYNETYSIQKTIEFILKKEYILK